MTNPFNIPLGAKADGNKQTRYEAYRALGMSEADASAAANAEIEREFGGGMSKAELGDFKTLVSRLENSKMKQAAQTNRARQRDTFAGGLASMMGNF
jgi:hypothetical protein